MIYRAIGLMSGSSLDGLDIAFVEFQENAGRWTYEIIQADCYPYPADWLNRLKNATSLPALDYQLLHIDYGHYLGQQVNHFIEQHQLHYKVALVASHGHTTFHMPAKKMTAQLGDGAAIAAQTKLPVITDLRALDVALGGQGAPIVPIGERLLWQEYDYFLNIGGIANLSINSNPYIAFDVCPANRVLNMLAADAGKEMDEYGTMAAAGAVNNSLLEKLSALDYYKQAGPKSLANAYGTDIVYPLIKAAGCSVPDALRTFSEHIAIQISEAISNSSDFKPQTSNLPVLPTGLKLLVTGGGAFNTFLIQQLQEKIKAFNIEVVVPDAKLVSYKEALIMALIGVLRWRQEYNVLASVTGASRDSIGGALWTGDQA
ncbi:MAG: anhydro-N-acetylmuramic acid kinase [Chitinophagales bacterium]|nr:anhydro-N-acetylmuramic acid kinase [Chitinophagales bacterium]